jgi:hypothetical protein
MRKTVITILGTLLIAGSAVQMATAAEYHKHRHRAPIAASQQFLNANNSIEGRASTSCQNYEPGNPYNEQTDYLGWSAWRQGGGWENPPGC